MSKLRRLWPLSVVALIALPILYVARFGLACWLANWEVLPLHGTGIAYRPLLNLTFHGPDRIQDAMLWYATLWLPNESGPDVFQMGEEAGVIRLFSPPF